MTLTPRWRPPFSFSPDIKYDHFVVCIRCKDVAYHMPKPPRLQCPACQGYLLMQGTQPLAQEDWVPPTSGPWPRFTP